jgi:signal peptide peptidase SppA
MKYARIIAEFTSRAWAIREETLVAMKELLRLKAFEGAQFSPREIQERINESNARNGYEPRAVREGARFLCFDQELEMEAASGKRNAAKPGSVALIPIMGIVSHRMNMMGDLSGSGGTSIESLTAQFRQALGDGNCKAIVFDVDSPGGSVEGVMELASEIYDARGQKPITAVVNAMACSAAYWLASAAKEIVCTPSGQAGSIGVYMTHQDESKALENDGIKITVIKAGKYKTEGNPSEALSDEARAAFQSKVDDYYGMFVKGVAQNRGTSQAQVREGYGQGRSLLAADAVKANLVDRLGTLDDVLGKYGVKPGSTSQSSAHSSQLDPKAAAKPNLPEDAPDNDDDDVPCGCAVLSGEACKACKGCENEDAPEPEDDGKMGCACACNACKACDGKPNSAAKATAMSLARRRRQMQNF